MLLGFVLLASGYVQGWFGDQKLCGAGCFVLSAVSAVPGQSQDKAALSRSSLCFGWRISEVGLSQHLVPTPGMAQPGFTHPL